MGKNILITGATGLIGTRLTKLLVQRGHQVSHLGRKKTNAEVPEFTWDIDLHIMDPRAVATADVIIHLAGANVGEGRWTKDRKKEIRDSRIESTELLFDVLKKGSYPVKTFISGSAIGFYGMDNNDIVFTEENGAGKDFLAHVTEEWESEASKIEAIGIRVVKVRTGIVLSRDGGALSSLSKPIRFGVGAAIGSGKQVMSWIHIDDLCMIFCKAAEDNSLKGAYNGVAPNPVTNLEMTRAVAKALKRPLWLPHVPAFLLKIALGEMAEIVVAEATCQRGKSLRQVSDSNMLISRTP